LKADGYIQPSQAGQRMKANGYVRASRAGKRVGQRPVKALKLAKACVAAIDAAQSDLPPSAGTRNAKRVSDELFFGLGDEIMYHCTAFSNAQLILSTLRTFCDGFGELMSLSASGCWQSKGVWASPASSQALKHVVKKHKAQVIASD
jgi:hypothetical protein